MLNRLKKRALNYLLQEVYDRAPTKNSSFAKLTEMNIPISTIIDVGVLESTPELITHFATAHHILCEPVSNFKERIHKAYSGNVSSYELIEAAIGSKNGHAYLQVSSVQPGRDITHSKIFENENPLSQVEQRRVPLTTVDAIMESRNREGGYLLKVDIDGLDLDVIEGAKSTLTQCNIICIEAGVKNIHQRLPAILSHGFQLFDIVDICYYDGRLIQVDLIFVRKTILKNMGYDFTDREFKIDQWQSYLY